MQKKILFSNVGQCRILDIVSELDFTLATMIKWYTNDQTISKYGILEFSLEFPRLLKLCLIFHILKAGTCEVFKNILIATLKKS